MLLLPPMMGTKLKHTESSSGSDFFSDVFSNCTQTSMLVYLKGISKSELGNILDFLYNGETFITQHELNSFLITAQELKVKGLQIADNETNEFESKPNIVVPEFKDTLLISSENTESYQSRSQNQALSRNEIILATDDEESDIIKENLDLDEKLENMIERSQGVWKCKICDKTSNYKSMIKRHAETHIEGSKHSCSICMKSFSTRRGVNVHKMDIHYKLYSCKICGRIDMNKATVRNTHKQNCQGIPQEQ